MSEKSAISSWVNNSKRFSLYVDNTEKSIFHGLDDEITNEWIDFSRAIHEDKVDVIRRIMHLRTLYQDITKKLQNPNLYHATNFQQMLEAFECRLSSFKQAMRTEFDSLELSEHALSNDLVSVLSHFEKLSEETLVAQVRSGSDSKKSILEKQQKDINRKAVIGELDRKVRAYKGPYSLVQLFRCLIYCFHLRKLTTLDCPSRQIRWMGHKRSRHFY